MKSQPTIRAISSYSQPDRRKAADNKVSKAMSKEATIQIHDCGLQTALRLMQSQNKHRVKVFDEWYGSTTDYYIDNIRLEASSGMVVGFSGGQRVFAMTTLQFSQYAVNGRVDAYYTVEHCSIRKSYTRLD